MNVASSMRRVHPADVPELQPAPIIIRRTGGGHGLEGKGHTYRGDYVLVSQASDGVSTSARVVHGSIPVDLLSSHSIDQHSNYNNNSNNVNHYPNAVHSHLITTSPPSTARSRQQQHRHQQQHLPPSGATSMLHFGGATLLVDLDENGSIANDNLSRNSPNRYNERNQATTSFYTSPPRPQSARVSYRCDRTNNNYNNNNSFQQLQQSPRTSSFTVRPPSSSFSKHNNNNNSTRFVSTTASARETNMYNTMTNNNQNGNVTRTTLLRQRQVQSNIANKASAAALNISNATIVSPPPPRQSKLFNRNNDLSSTNIAEAASRMNHQQQQEHRQQQYFIGKTIKTKKTAALTPGALRIIQGQLNNGASVETVVRRQAQSQRDRVYRPRTDRILEQETAGGEVKFQEHLLSSLHAAGVSGDHLSFHNTIHPDLPKEAKLENYYSPSRRHKNISTIRFDDDHFSHHHHHHQQHYGSDGTMMFHHDSKPAVDFDPYALSLLSTLPPLSASTNPYITGRQELRRPHPMSGCPGAIVMHTALGHLRAVGAIPYLLDCSFGVYAVKPKLTEEEKMKLLEDELVFNYLSDDGEDDSDDDPADDPLLSMSLTKGINKKRTKLASGAMDDDDDILSSLSPKTAGGGEESPTSAFRKTAQELLQPLPKNAFEVAAISHHRKMSTSAATMKEMRQKLSEKKKRVEQFDPNEMIDSGVTVSIDGRALSDHPSKVTRPRFRVFTIFCERHPLPGLKSVCRVPFPKPAPHEWNPTDIIVCFGWRADVDAELSSMENLVGDAFFKNTGLKEHAWESTLLERRLVFQFFSPPVDEDFYTGDPKTAIKKRGSQLMLKNRGAFHRGDSGFQDDNNSATEASFDYNMQEYSFFGTGPGSGSQSQLPDGAKHQPFRVHDFEMSASHEAGYRIFTWEGFSKEFSRALGEAFLRGI